MLIRYVKEHGPHPAGREFDHPAPGVAMELIRRGVAVEVTATTAAPPPPPVPPPPREPKRRA